MASTWATDGGREPGDQGSSAVELVIIFPVVLLIVLAIIQFGVCYHAADIARAAAQQGVKAESAYGASPGVGQAGAAQVLADNGRDLVRDVVISPTRADGLARVTVTGQALQVIPLIRLSITESATAPIEQFEAPGP